jgi:hypothetical protein
MSALPPGALHRSRSSPALPRVNPVERPASKAAAASATRNGDSGSHVKSTVAAGELRQTSATFKQTRRDELDSIVARAGEVAALLGELSSDDVDQALAVIFAARSQLDQTERQLVRLAVKDGRGWARVGVALGIQGGRATRERFGSIGSMGSAR